MTALIDASNSLLGRSFTQRLLSAEVTRSRKPSVKKGKIFLIRKKNERVDHRESLSSVLGNLFELRVSMRLIKKKKIYHDWYYLQK